MASLQSLLIQLDAVLTGKPPSVVQHMSENQKTLVSDPVYFATQGDSYYLSDGGYSCVVWVYHENNEHGHLALSNVSRDEVRKRWRSDPEAQKIVADINRVVVDAIIDEEKRIIAPGQ